jgi:hypothetical protein
MHPSTATPPQSARDTLARVTIRGHRADPRLSMSGDPLRRGNVLLAKSGKLLTQHATPPLLGNDRR